MRNGLITPLDFIKEFRGQRGRDSEGNSVTLEVKSQVPCGAMTALDEWDAVQSE